MVAPPAAPLPARSCALKELLQQLCNARQFGPLGLVLGNLGLDIRQLRARVGPCLRQVSRGGAEEAQEARARASEVTRRQKAGGGGGEGRGPGQHYHNHVNQYFIM